MVKRNLYSLGNLIPAFPVPQAGHIIKRTASDDNWEWQSAPKTVITSLDDLPEPVGDVITLEENTCYQVDGYINLEGNRIVAPNSTSPVVGLSARDELYTENSGALFTIEVGFTDAYELRRMALTNPAGSALSYTGSGFGVLLLTSVAMEGANPSVFSGATAVTLAQCSFGGSDQGIEFDGDIISIEIALCAFGPFFDDAAIGVNFASTVNAEFVNLIGNVFLVDGYTDTDGYQVGINQEVGATIGEGKLSINQFRGIGEFTSGFDKGTPSWIFSENSGLLDSKTIVGAAYNVGSPETFTNPGAGSFDIIPGTLTIGAIERFTETSPGVFRYDGYEDKEVLFSTGVSVEVATGSNVIVALALAVNGAELTATIQTVEASSSASSYLATQTVITIKNGDTVEAHIANNTNGNDLDIFSHQISVFS